MKIVNIIICIVLSHIGLAQGIDSLGLLNFSDAVLELQNSELVRHGMISVCVKSAKDGQVIFALNQERSLPSASTLKLVTTATALSLLGGDFRYQTFLEYDGVISHDTLNGNLYLRGTGDPSLGSDRFKDYPGAGKLAARWASAVAKSGIKYIKGRVIGDESFFEGNMVADSWIYADLGNYYGAGANGLNFNENLYKIKFKPGTGIGDPTLTLGTEPTVRNLNFTNYVLTGEKGSGDQVTIYGTPLNNNIILRGTVPAGFASFTVKGSLPDPAGYAAGLLKETLTGASVSILEIPDSLVAPGRVMGPRKQLDEYKSPPLRELCQQTNWWSINLYADSFARLIGKRLNGQSDYSAGAESMGNYWRTRNADMRGFYAKDGSGLSPSASLTTQNLTEVLSVASRDKNLFPDFYKSIGVLGQNGTVRNLGKGTKAAGNIRAKSGSIEGTRAYAGYVTAKSGALLSFALIAHKYQQDGSRVVSEELVRLMALLAEL
jgi:D-alanyl-D-alanine carboxypeptidase/D-alanyl-D-alanine-endopeptidase (penicillin-binding protein 4)